ncbi:substrate-binding domain-containing protein, partial [Hymenobacter endophyticus]
EVPVYAATTMGVVFFGVLEGVGIGVAVAVAVALHRLTRTRITHEEDQNGVHHVRVRGQLTFLAVPRLSRTLHLVPQEADAVVELDGSFMDHAAYESLHDWQSSHTAQGGSVELTGRSGARITEPAGAAGEVGGDWFDVIPLDGGKSQKIVMMNGAVTDPNAAEFKKAALAELSDKVTIAKQYDTKDWKPSNARANMMAAISSIGAENIAGVYSAN